jgi:hypothetical protein
MPSRLAYDGICSHIDPGPLPDFEEEAQDVDMDTPMEDGDLWVRDAGVGLSNGDLGLEEREQGTDIGRLEENTEVEGERAMDHDPVSNVHRERIIISIDFGTTFSSVAYVVLPAGDSPEDIDLRRVRCVDNYPGYEPVPGVIDNRHDVPTELWYDDGSVERERQHHHLLQGNDDDEQQSNDEDDASSTSSDGETTEIDESHFEDDGAAGTQQPTACLARATQYWGYQVQHRLNTTNVHRDQARPLTRFKLNLEHKKATEEKQETQDLRTDMRGILKNLIKKRIISNETDIYTDYLTHLLKHTKTQLELYDDLRPGMLFQFVLCVPAKWPMNGCRIMQR